MSFARLDYPAEKLAPFGRDKIVMQVTNDIEANMRIHACGKEPWTVEFIEALPPGSVLWDIGANVGPYTLLGAARGLRVVAFEPMPENYAALCRNLALNNLLDQVLTLPIALAEVNGLAWLHYSDMRSGSASHTLNASARKQSIHKQLMPILKGDELAGALGLPLPNAIKVDVDGLERQVLQGIAGILQSNRDIRSLMVELQPEWEDELTASLASLGFPLTGRWDERGGKKIGIAYGQFTRPPATESDPPTIESLQPGLTRSENANPEITIFEGTGDEVIVRPS